MMLHEQLVKLMHSKQQPFMLSCVNITEQWHMLNLRTPTVKLTSVGLNQFTFPMSFEVVVQLKLYLALWLPLVAYCTTQSVSTLQLELGCQVGERQHYYAHHSFHLLAQGWYSCVNYVFSWYVGIVEREEGVMAICSQLCYVWRWGWIVLVIRTRFHHAQSYYWGH